MVLILLVYISISFCSNFLYAQICRVGVEMHSRQSSVNSVMSWLLSIIRAEDVYYWEQPEDLIFYFTAGLCLLTFLASGRPGLGRREPGRQLNWCSTISTPHSHPSLQSLLAASLLPSDNVTTTSSCLLLAGLDSQPLGCSFPDSWRWNKTSPEPGHPTSLIIIIYSSHSL